MTVKDPAVQADDYDQALRQAMTMTGSPVTLTNGSDSWTLHSRADHRLHGLRVHTPGRCLHPGALSVRREDGSLPRRSGDRRCERVPVDASFKGDGQKAWVVAAVAGSELDRDKTVELLNAAALDADDRDVQAAMTIVEPNLTTDEAKAMGINVKLAGFQTEWEGTPDRQTNVQDHHSVR